MPKAGAAFDRRAAIHDTTIGWRFVNDRIAAQYGIDSMPETAENLTEAFGIARADQDAFAHASQQKTLRAVASGRLGEEIAAVTIPARKGDPAIVSADEHPRATTLEKLAALPAPFRAGGSVTAGNASGVNDGAAAVLLASEDAVARYGLTPLAEYLGAASAGVSPRIMGIGPVPSTRALMDRLNLTIGDFDVIELNEAFAAQALAVCRDLGIAPAISLLMRPSVSNIATCRSRRVRPATGRRSEISAMHQTARANGSSGVAERPSNRQQKGVPSRRRMMRSS